MDGRVEWGLTVGPCGITHSRTSNAQRFNQRVRPDRARPVGVATLIFQYACMVPSP